RNLERSAGFALGVAEQINLVDPTFKRAPTTPAAPPDVAVVRSSETGKTIAVTQPPGVEMGTGKDSPASRQIVSLVHDGVPLTEGRVRPDHVFWDATLAKPADVARVLAQARAALATNLDDLSRLRVMLPGSVAPDEASLRRLLSLSAD